MKDILSSFVAKAGESGCKVHIANSIEDCVNHVAPLLSEIKGILWSGEMATDLVNLAEIPDELRNPHPDAYYEPDTLLGITDATSGIAETGTIVLSLNTKDDQLVSLVPATVVVLLKQNRILRRFEEAFQSLNLNEFPYILFLSGPSVTADIEKEIVYGVHGPSRVIVIVLR